MGWRSLLHGIFPTQGLNLSLLHCRQIFYHLSYQESPNTVNLNPIESCMCAKLLQSYQTLCDPMDCSLQGSSVHGSLQARTLENTGLPCPPPGDLLTQGSNPCLLSPLHWRAGSLPLALPSKMAFLEVQMVKNLGLIPVSGRSPEEENGYPLQYSCLDNSMDREAWWAVYSSWNHKELDTAKRLMLLKELIITLRELPPAHSHPHDIHATFWSTGNKNGDMRR